MRPPAAKSGSNRGSSNRHAVSGTRSSKKYPWRESLGKHEQVYGLRLRLGNHVQVLLDIARDIPKVRVDLRKADAE